MILLIDHFDSFTENIAHAFSVLGQRVVIRRPHSLSVQKIAQFAPSHVVIGPGPGSPDGGALASLQLIQSLPNPPPVLGICLGHQCIAKFFGGSVLPSPSGPIHGKRSQIFHDYHGVFAHIPSPFQATCYHSLVVDPPSLPKDLTATAKRANGEIMGIAHKTKPLYGVQFHPESATSEYGQRLFKNFLQLKR